MQGWLHKQPGGKEGITVGNFLRNWDRRWFTLDDKTGKLVYYKANSDASELSFVGNLDIEHDTVTDQQLGAIQQRTFVVRTGTNALTLRADDKAAMEGWIKALKAVTAMQADVATIKAAVVAPTRQHSRGARADGAGLEHLQGRSHQRIAPPLQHRAPGACQEERQGPPSRPEGALG
jgi:hypothetical protein